MSKLRILLAIPCLMVSLALIGCGGGTESTFTPAEVPAVEPPPEGDPVAPEGDPVPDAPVAPEGDPVPEAPEGDPAPDAPAAP